MVYKDCLQQIQNYLENNPLIILGSGASASYGLPLMSDLKTEIVNNEGRFDKAEFLRFNESLKTMNLEEAMDKTKLSVASCQAIREIVWNFINQHDLEFFSRLISNKNSFPIADLLKKIIQPTPNNAVVVTTNYDRIAEYAADYIKATTITGFEGNLIKTKDFPANGTQNKRISARERTVSIWKVHGSLDWFTNTQGDIVGYPFSTSIPPSFTPLVIPPGKDKYGTAHSEPYRDVIAQADNAFSKAGSFLCVGYGFNDEHIQPKLIEQIRSGKPIVVLCHTSTEACKRNIISPDVKKYVVIEYSATAKTTVSGNGYSEEYDGCFWDLGDFIKTIWG